MKSKKLGKKRSGFVFLDCLLRTKPNKPEDRILRPFGFMVTAVFGSNYSYSEWLVAVVQNNLSTALTRKFIYVSKKTLVMFGAFGMRVSWRESRHLIWPSWETLACSYARSATSGWLSPVGDVSFHSASWRWHFAQLCESHWRRRGVETGIMNLSPTSTQLLLLKFLGLSWMAILLLCCCRVIIDR